MKFLGYFLQVCYLLLTLLKEAQGRREAAEETELVTYKEVNQRKERADEINSEVDSNLSVGNGIDPALIERMSKYKRKSSNTD